MCNTLVGVKDLQILRPKNHKLYFHTRERTRIKKKEICKITIPVKKRYIDEGENLGSQLADEK